MINHVSTVNAGGDVNWWVYGAKFVRTFEQDGVTYRELWNVLGIESMQMMTDAEIDEDNPNTTSLVYRCSLSDNPENDVFNISSTTREAMEQDIRDYEAEHGFSPQWNKSRLDLDGIDKYEAELRWIMDNKLSWASLSSIYDLSIDLDPNFSWVQLLIDVYEYHGWENGDSYPSELTQAEIRSILCIE